jgi:hypothetical protein
MQRTRFIGKNEHKMFILDEGMKGSELRSWARKNKIPIFKKKMRRTRFPKVEKKEKKLILVVTYLKNNPEMKRTKFKNNA